MSATNPQKLGAFYTALLFVGLHFPFPDGMEGTLKCKPLSEKQSGLSGAYKLVASASFVSQTGSWLQITALPMIMLAITHNAAQWLGTYWIVIALVGIPCALWGGIFADKFSTRLLALWTQIVRVAASCAICYLLATGSVHAWLLIGLQALGVMASTIGAPAQKKLFLALVNREAEERAVAVNSWIQSLAKVIGPALAGLILVWIQPAWLFFADFFSYLPLLAAIAALPWLLASTKSRQVKSAPGEQPSPQPSAEKVRLRDAIHYAWQDRSLRLVLFVSAIMVVFTFNGGILNPLMASQVFHRSSSYGLLLTAQGIGQMLALSVIARSSKKTETSDEKLRLLRPGPNQMLLWAVINCVASIGYAFSRWLPIGLIITGLMGGTVGPYLNAVDTLVQTTPEKHMRGRIIGLQAGLSGVSNLIGTVWTSQLVTAGFAASRVLKVNGTAALALVVVVAVIWRRQQSAGK